MSELRADLEHAVYERNANAPWLPLIGSTHPTVTPNPPHRSDAQPDEIGPTISGACVFINYLARTALRACVRLLVSNPTGQSFISVHLLTRRDVASTNG